MSKASTAYLAELRAQAQLYEKYFGHLVNQVRNEQGLSQQDFGEAVGVSRTEMHHLEGGQTDMKLSTFFSSAAPCIAALRRSRRISNIRWSIQRIACRKNRGATSAARTRDVHPIDHDLEGEVWFDSRRTDDAVMPLRFDSSPPLRMDQGLKFDAGPVPSPYQPMPRRNKAMTKFKLELFKKKTADKLTLGATHIAAMTGNASYPAATRVPSDAQVQTAQDDLATAQADVNNAEVIWKQKIQLRDQKEEAWDTVITARANNCEAVTPNDLAALQSTGFPLRSAGAPIGALPAPGDLRATPADNEGVIELRCDTVKGASSYEWECKVHDNLTAPWQAIKSSTTAKILVPALTPGTLYAFRVRAIGSAGPGAWSDEASGRAP